MASRTASQADVRKANELARPPRPAPDAVRHAPVDGPGAGDRASGRTRTARSTQAFDRIFSCQGHGWANLQSMHINLPFADDAEFGRLHAAIRFLLPLLPGLTASSPVMDGAVTGIDGQPAGGLPRQLRAQSRR